MPRTSSKLRASALIGTHSTSSPAPAAAALRCEVRQCSRATGTSVQATSAQLPSVAAVSSRSSGNDPAQGTSESSVPSTSQVGGVSLAGSPAQPRVQAEAERQPEVTERDVPRAPVRQAHPDLGRHQVLRQQPRRSGEPRESSSWAGRARGPRHSTGTRVTSARANASGALNGLM